MREVIDSLKKTSQLLVSFQGQRAAARLKTERTSGAGREWPGDVCVGWQVVGRDFVTVARPVVDECSLIPRIVNLATLGWIDEISLKLD